MTQHRKLRAEADPIPPSKVRAKPERETSTDDVLLSGHAVAATFPRGDRWAQASHVSIVGLFVIAVIWAAYVAQPVIVPILLAWVIATIMLPVVRWMAERKVPRVLAAILVTFALVAVIVSLLAALSSPVTFWLGRATELGALIKVKLQSMSQPLAALDEIRKMLNTIGSDAGPGLKVEQPSAPVVTTIFSVVTPAITQFVLFIGALIFSLVYQTRLRSTVVYLFTDRDTRLMTLRVLSDVDEQMTRFFSVFTLVNLSLGTVTVLLAWATGLPNPLLWGVLAAVLNYVPYVGPAVVATTLAVVGLITFPTIGEAAVAPLIYVAIVTVEGHFLTPTLIGRQLELNPFAIFLAIAFCTWLWGPIGAFLAVPLLMAMTVILGRALAEDKPHLPE